MSTQLSLLANALRSVPLFTLIESASDRDTVVDAVAARLLALGTVVATGVHDTDGCGFWLPAFSKVDADPDEWWSCVVPDPEHRGRDHVLVRRDRSDAA